MISRRLFPIVALIALAVLPIPASADAPAAIRSSWSPPVRLSPDQAKFEAAVTLLLNEMDQEKSEGFPATRSETSSESLQMLIELAAQTEIVFPNSQLRNRLAQTVKDHILAVVSHVHSNSADVF